jgi:TetR/AcrR family transcriptional regulator, repressor for divergent bdcA
VIDTKKERTRGRPRCFDRATAVNTALSLFRQKGYDSVGVAELSNALGINPPSLYAAFGNKLGLFEEALRSYADKEGRFIAEAVSGADSLEEAVRNLLVEAARSFSKCRDQPGCLVLDGTRNCTDADARATTDVMRQQIKVFLQKSFSAYQVSDSDAIAEYVIIAMTGLSGAARQGVEREVLIEAARRFAAAIMTEEGD